MEMIEKIETFAVKTALGYLDKDPEGNLPKLMEWFDRLDFKGTLKVQRDASEGSSACAGCAGCQGKGDR